MTPEKVNFNLKFNTDYFTNGRNTEFTPVFSWKNTSNFSFFDLSNLCGLSFFNPNNLFSYDFSSIKIPKMDFSNIFSQNNQYNFNKYGSYDFSKLFNKDFSFKFDTFEKSTSNTTGTVGSKYMNLSKAQALVKAKNDSNLEELKGGTNWNINSATFVTDIPYAKKGTADILDKVAQMVGQKLVINSALGTGEPGNPHVKGGYKSHHNSDNPKLDIDIPTNLTASEFAQKLRATGYFSHILNEGTHLDVQIDINKYETA